MNSFSNSTVREVLGKASCFSLDPYSPWIKLGKTQDKKAIVARFRKVVIVYYEKFKLFRRKNINITAFNKIEISSPVVLKLFKRFLKR